MGKFDHLPSTQNNHFPEVFIRRAESEAQRQREIERRTHPRTAMARDIVEALNQPERINRIWSAIEIVAMNHNAGASHLRDQQEKDCYRELKAVLAETTAELPEFREFMGKMADWLGW